MYNKLYDNCFKTELNTKVLKVEEENGLYWHACKDTIFYVESGGMASDIGMMDNHMVLGPVSYTHLDVYKRQSLCKS